ncbi:xylose isomerase-like protein [Lipomyces oligophaga]|uniref:xylose isomerase-like protein n=1 Tax=Lipomyces oligophaga TaxID=45792 RepID=UPI0034CE5921
MSESDSDIKPTRGKRTKRKELSTAKLASKRAKAEVGNLSKDKDKMASRTPALKMFVGAHVSSAKGVFNAVSNSNRIGGNAFALFVKQQRRWTAPPYKPEEVTEFAKLAKEHNYDTRKYILPHGSYLINLANLDEEKNQQAYNAFLDELQRCEALNIGLYNFHPGSTLGLDKQKCLKQLANNINRAIKATSFVKIILENMAGHGNLVGSTWEDLHDVIEQVEDKSRVGVCVDTCHTFASGYDIRTQSAYDKVWNDFDKIIGLEYLSAIHLNDSKAPLGSNRDLHQNIGTGFLGLESFRVLMNTKHLQGLPLILETPNHDDDSVWAEEIKLLESLIGKSQDDAEFIQKRDELSKKGAAERSEMEKKTKAQKEKKQKTLSLKRKKAKDNEDSE